jgi:hypothetical protein
MPMLEGQVDAVIGVDTHRDTHAAALLDPTGGAGHPGGAKRPGPVHPPVPAGPGACIRSAGLGAGRDGLLWGPG